MEKSIFVNPAIQKYVKEHSLKLTRHQIKLIEHTANFDFEMMGSVDEIQLFQVLIKSMGAKKCLEIGCFTGYTTLCLAEAMPDDGFIFTCDITDEAVAKEIWKEAGVANKIKLEIGNGENVLKNLIEKKESFDFAFIDADKENYPIYYEQCLKLVRKGGIIAIDNVLWSGGVLEKKKDSISQIIHDLNVKVKNDPRVDISMLPVGDGVTLCYVK